MFDTVKDTVLEDQYVSAVREYTNGNYEDAISQFMEIMNTDHSYKDGRAAYYLAHCYYQQKDGTNAAKWFQVVVDQDGASSSIKKRIRKTSINFNSILIKRNTGSAIPPTEMLPEMTMREITQIPATISLYKKYI